MVGALQYRVHKAGKERVQVLAGDDVAGDRIADRDRLSDPVGESDEVLVFQALSGG